MARRHYVLTTKAATDLREARSWSHARWGKELTRRYFEDLHRGAQFVAENQRPLARRPDLTGGTTLLLYPVREHYLVYEPLGRGFIAIVAVIRQGRDIPNILRKWAVPIQRELSEIRERIAPGELAVPAMRSSRGRRKATPAKARSRR